MVGDMPDHVARLISMNAFRCLVRMMPLAWTALESSPVSACQVFRPVKLYFSNTNKTIQNTSIQTTTCCTWEGPKPTAERKNRLFKLDLLKKYYLLCCYADCQCRWLCNTFSLTFGVWRHFSTLSALYSQTGY